MYESHYRMLSKVMGALELSLLLLLLLLCCRFHFSCLFDRIWFWWLAFREISYFLVTFFRSDVLSSVRLDVFHMWSLFLLLLFCCFLFALFILCMFIVYWTSAFLLLLILFSLALLIPFDTRKKKKIK